MRTDLRVKHDVETRRHAAELFDSGMGRWAASRALSIPRGTVRQRRRIYRAFGSEVLLTMDGKQARYTYEQSVAAASAVADGGATKAEAVAVLRSRRSSRALPTAAATGRWLCACAPSWARIADKTMLKMMREMGIRCGIRRETDYHKHNSYKGIVGEIFENVIGRDDTRVLPNARRLSAILQ